MSGYWLGSNLGILFQKLYVILKKWYILNENLLI